MQAGVPLAPQLGRYEDETKAARDAADDDRVTTADSAKKPLAAS